MAHRQTVPKLKTYHGYSCGNCGHEPLFSSQRHREIGLTTHRLACGGSTGPMPKMYRTTLRLPVT